MMVSVGFLSALVTKAAPSVTNRLATSCAWQYWFSTEVVGFPPCAPCRFVDDDAPVGDAVGARPSGRVVVVDAAARFDDRAEGLLHVLRHPDFVVAPLPVKAQHGDAPLINRVGIHIAIAVIRNHLAPPGKADVGAVAAAASLLQGRTVAFEVIAEIRRTPPPGHGASAPELDVVAAQEVVLAVKFPPGHIDVHAADAVVIVRRHFFQLGKVAATIELPTVSVRVAADHPGGIRQAVGK
jgi:hypothetical protein